MPSSSFPHGGCVTEYHLLCFFSAVKLSCQTHNALLIAATIYLFIFSRSILIEALRFKTYVSLTWTGCLKAPPTTMFDPQLPEDKSQAIEKLGFACINKIFLHYEEAFWERDVESISLLWEDETPASLPTDATQWQKNIQLFTAVRPREKLVIWLQYQDSISNSTQMLKSQIYLCYCPAVCYLCPNVW